MVNDIRHALRSLGKSPGLVTVVVLCLALGIGANTTIFALTNAVFLRPLPVREPHRLVRFYTGWDGVRFRSSAYPEYQALNGRADAFAGVSAYSRVRINVGRGDETTVQHGIIATGNIFEVIGLAPAAGRFFSPDHDRVPSEHRVAVLSHQFWQQRFGGDPAAIGQALYLNGQRFTIMGVAPADFTAIEPESDAALWVPMMTYREVTGGDETRLLENSHWLSLIGRLAPGIDLEQARSAATAVARERVAALGARAPRGYQFTVLRGGTFANTEQSAEVFAMFVILGCVVGLVLLIACANVANVLLARSFSRRREMAIRLALGSGRWRLVRQLLAEALVLGMMGGAAGFLVAWWAADLLTYLHLPAALDAKPDWRVFVYAFLLALTTAILFGLAPAIQVTRAPAAEAMKQGGRLGASIRSRLRSTLVVGQMTLSVLLLVVAGLMLRALQELQHSDTGVVEEGVLTAELDVAALHLPPAQGQLLFDDLLARVRATPGVVGATLSAMLPSGQRQWFAGGVTLPEHAQYGKEQISIGYNTTEPDYFRVMGVPLLRGRGLSDAAADARAVVINEAFARRYWSGRDPLGTHIRTDEREPPWEVVGIVRDVRYESAGQPAPPTMYATYRQLYETNLTLQVRTRGDYPALARLIRRELQAAHPGLAADFTTLSDIRRASEASSRLIAILLGIFGALALLLAAVGLYGVVAYTVVMRKHEIAVRMALGARPRRVVELIAGQALALVSAGLLLGSILALAAGSLLAGAIYGMRSFDPLVMSGVGALMVAIGLLASAVPTRRAASVDPASALRAE